MLTLYWGNNKQHFWSPLPAITLAFLQRNNTLIVSYDVLEKASKGTEVQCVNYNCTNFLKHAPFVRLFIWYVYLPAGRHFNMESNKAVKQMSWICFSCKQISRAQECNNLLWEDGIIGCHSEQQSHKMKTDTFLENVGIGIANHLQTGNWL